MGIPGFFAWLLKKYRRNTITIQNIGTNVDSLYVDANCMLHPSCFKVLNATTGYVPVEELENNMIDMCIQDLDYMINYVSPQKMLYVAVDGVAPLAKINQQRKRRYKSAMDTQLKNDIKEKYGVVTNNSWTNSSITPGTAFMEKLHERLYKYLKTIRSPRRVIYSSYHTPGEGEHKIFDYIRDTKDTTRTVKVIYGLDADLIFLAMANQQPNMYLIRENSEFSHAPSENSSFVYVVIDSLTNCFNEQLNNQISESFAEMGIRKEITANNTNDIIFICYLLGNDFLPHVPTIDIRRFGLEMLLNAYVSVYVKYLKPMIKIMDDDVEIDMIFFDDFICQLSLMEREWLETCDDVPNRIEPIFNMQLDRELWRLENMKIIQSDDIFQRHLGTFDDWKFRYYEHHFGCTESQEQTTKEICKNYLDGILWITKYYFGKCPSWSWTYNYSHAPFVTDLSKFIKTQRYNINDLQFDTGKPLLATIQLLCVIPGDYSHLLPMNYAKLMNSSDSLIADMFPTKFKIDVMNNDMYWKCIPILPQLDIDRVQKEVSKIKSDNSVKKYNEQFEDILIK
jgi:5'-3' exonuclease